MPKIKPPRGTKRRDGKLGVGKRSSAAVIKLPNKRSGHETSGSQLDLSVDVEYLLPKLDDE